MHLTGLDLFFWAASFIGHVALLVVLWIRSRIRSFPIFTALVGMNVLRTSILFLIQCYGTKAQYFYTFWSFAILDVGLQLGVVYEMASQVFRPSQRWDDRIRRHLIWWILCSIAIAAGVTWTAAPPTTMWMQTVLIKGSFFSAALMSELFAGMIALSAVARLPFNTHGARISVGLGVYSMATLGLETARTYFGLQRGSHVYTELSHLRIAIYMTCLLYWIITLSRNTSTHREMPELMRRQLSELRCNAARRVHMLQSWRQP